MRILSIEPDKRKKEVLVITLEDRRRVKARAEDVIARSLRSGDDLDEEAEAAFAAKLRKHSARVTAVNVLSYKSYSKTGLEKRLREKGLSSDEAADSADWLEKLGYLNDEEFARAILSTYLKKGCGATRIREEMRRRGISRELSETLTAELDVDEAIDGFLRGKLKGRFPDRDEMRRLTDALIRRGHSYEDIKSAFRRLDAEVDDI